MRILSFERGGFGSHYVEESFWKKLWTCGQTEYWIIINTSLVFVPRTIRIRVGRFTLALNLPLIPMAEKTACVWHEFLIKCLFCKLLKKLPVVVIFIYDKPTAAHHRIPMLPLRLLCIDYVAKTVRYSTARLLHDFHLSCQTNGRCKTRALNYCNIFANVACPQLYRLFWKHKSCMISGFRHEVAQNCALLGCYAASSSNFLPTFRDKLSVPSSGFKDSWTSKNLRTLRMGPISCTEASVNSPRDTPEEPSSQT